MYISHLAKEEFLEFEDAYWRASPAVDFVFNLGVGMGLLVDHLPEYVTLKSMGDTSMNRVVVTDGNHPVGLLGPPPHLLVAQGSLWLNLRSHNHPPHWHEHLDGHLCTGHDRYRVRHLRAMGKLRDAVTLPKCSSGHPPWLLCHGHPYPSSPGQHRSG